LYPPDEEAMYWVRDNTPVGSRFLVLTGTTSVSCDSVTEWFPALTDRQSLFTVQGTEWTKRDDFGEFIQAENDLQMCSEGNPLECHRFSMISVYLEEIGIHVKHILKDKSVKTHVDLEKELLKKYEMKLPRPSLFEPDLDTRRLIKHVYKLHNKEIGWQSMA
jgi:hypothetical protein